MPLHLSCKGVLLALGMLLSVLLKPDIAVAQQEPPPKVDSTSIYIKKQNEILNNKSTDKRSERNSRFYKEIKRIFSKNQALKDVYQLIFRDPSKEVQVQQTPKVQNPNRKYDGKYIGKITIKSIDPFGPKVNDTLRQARNWFERAGNRIHFSTRRGVIRKNYLLFDQGSKLDYEVLSNNERILRTSPNLLDARIIVIPRADDKDTVDIMVITQDVWSISADGSTSGFTSGNIGLEDKNLFGFGHVLRTVTSYDQAQEQKWGFRGRYRVPYIGKTFVSGEAEYINEWNNDSYAFRLQKAFLAPTIKYAGGLELSHNRVQSNVLFPNDTLQISFPVTYNLQDMWVGRSFRFYSGSEQFRKSSRIILAARALRYHFTQRPEVRIDTNQLFQNRITYLGSVSFNSRNYFRDLLIYGFGRTEDVPYGGLVSLIAGVEKTEFGQRLYGGFKVAHAQYYSRIGYLYSTINFGSFYQNKSWEQGIITIGANYFSPLINFKQHQIRQFVNARYSIGTHRFSGEFIDLNNNNGIRGISSRGLRGTKRLSLGLETVLFTPSELLGFRIAIFGFTDLGFISFQGDPLLNSTLYQGYGLGVRLRNENLAFNTFQLRLSFYPNIPFNEIPVRTSLSGIPSLRLTDFDVSAPATVPFQ